MTRFRTLAAVTALWTAVPAHADDLADLLNRVPGDMNTVAVVNVRAINQSPRAVREKWLDNHETEYLAGALAVPPWVPAVVIGADLHPGSLARGRSLALIPVDASVNSAAVARRENGVVQTVDDLTLVLSPKRGYFGWPAGGVLAVSSTLPRQDFARWVRGARTADRPAVAAYLQEAVAAHKAAHVLIATNLKDLIDPTAARAALQQSGAVPREAELDSLVAVLAGARGLVFTAQVGDATTAELRIEFAVPMADFLPAFRRLWPLALERAGLEVEELRAAEPRADGRAVVLTTALSDTSLRRVLSLVAAPGDAVPSSGTARIKTPREAAGLAAALRYYRAVNGALDDLKAQGGARGKDYVRSAAFFDAYAAKVEKLPLTDVDPVLVQYGASVAAKLRAMAGSLRGTKAQLEVYDGYKSTVWAAGGWGWWGGGQAVVRTNVPELSARQAELAARLEPERAKIWGVLEGDRSALRRELLDRYQIDFDQYKK